MKNSISLPFSFSSETPKVLEEVIHPLIRKFYQELVEYLLIISPPDNIKHEVNIFKDRLAKEHGDYAARHSIAHLTLASFLLHPKREEALIRSLQYAAAEESVKTFTINGFAAFDASNTLYLKIKELSSFSQLSKNINNKTLRIYLPGSHKNITNNPHLTIGKGLSNLPTAKNMFLHQEYTRDFVSTGLILLKRNEKNKYVLVQEIPFLSKAPAQLTLYSELTYMG